MSLKRARSSSPPSNQPSFARSAELTDRGSTFVGYYSPTLTASAIQALEEISSATHRIAAWRKKSSQRTISTSSQPLYDIGHDDDGEKYAGKHVEKVLTDMHVEGAIVVARYYGGILLGPVRFTHIEICAKEAVKAWRIAESERIEHAHKRRETEKEGELHRPKLEATLIERDRSIEVLRKLLADKRGGEVITGKERDTSNNTNSSPQLVSNKTINYSTMSVAALKKLERARDATIGFILKQLDKIEAERSNDMKEAPQRSTHDAVDEGSGNLKCPTLKHSHSE